VLCHFLCETAFIKHSQTVSHRQYGDVLVQVRTKDQIFDSVGHLVDFHMSNGVPIVSADSELVLVTPVTRGPREM